MTPEKRDKAVEDHVTRNGQRALDRCISLSAWRAIEQGETLQDVVFRLERLLSLAVFFGTEQSAAEIAEGVRQIRPRLGPPPKRLPPSTS